MERLDLLRCSWTVRASGDLGGVPAAALAAVTRGVPAGLVPGVGGCVHTDLIDAGVIADPAAGMNEAACAWVSRTDWVYEAELTAPASWAGRGDAWIEFECLDTAAAVSVNGVVVGRAASEFVPWRFSLAGVLRAGANVVRVEFAGPARYVEAERARLGAYPHNGDAQGWLPYNMMRKSAVSLGWDFAPRVGSCGISGGAWVGVGGQGMFDRAMASRGVGVARRARFDPERYRLIVDGRERFARGVNWVPEGLWPRDRTAGVIRRRLEQARAMGAEVVRVWGGGRYESEAFYDACDELGLWVWQDFMFACACYPEDEATRALVEAEARYQVARLSRHPCVVLWCGGNENHWAYASWGFTGRVPEVDGREAGRGLWYWHDLLPRVVAERGDGVAYVPDSPWTPGMDPRGGDANASCSGDRHTWDHFGDAFRSHVPAFCSEFGVQSPSCVETLREAGLLAGEAGGGGPGWGGVVPAALVARQRGPGGMDRWYGEMMGKAFPGGAPPEGFVAWHGKAQGMQASWVGAAVVWLRANGDRCGGALVWQLNEPWAGFSWSLIDAAGREKPAYRAVARAMAPRVSAVVPRGGEDWVVAVNDTGEVWRSTHDVEGVGAVGFEAGAWSVAWVRVTR